MGLSYCPECPGGLFSRGVLWPAFLHLLLTPRYRAFVKKDAYFVFLKRPYPFVDSVFIFFDTLQILRMYNIQI